MPDFEKLNQVFQIFSGIFIWVAKMFFHKSSWLLLPYLSVCLSKLSPGSAVVPRPGHRARNSDSTSIYYYEIRELKKTFKFNSGNPNYLPKVSFKWKKNGPKLVNFTPDRIKQIDKRIVWGEISTLSKDCTQKLEAVQQKFNG